MFVKDKRKLREVLEENEIFCVINVFRFRVVIIVDVDYVFRRVVVDFGIFVCVFMFIGDIVVDLDLVVY